MPWSPKSRRLASEILAARRTGDASCPLPARQAACKGSETSCHGCVLLAGNQARNLHTNLAPAAFISSEPPKPFKHPNPFTSAATGWQDAANWLAGLENGNLGNWAMILSRAVANRFLRSITSVSFPRKLGVFTSRCLSRSRNHRICAVFMIEFALRWYSRSLRPTYILKPLPGLQLCLCLFVCGCVSFCACQAFSLGFWANVLLPQVGDH